jgi:hypothetical protein
MRNLDPATAAALSMQNVGYGVMAMIRFKSSTQYVWSGPGPLTASIGGVAQTFTGTGSLGAIGTIDEGSDGTAEGTTASLSGIDPVFLADALTDIRIGAPAMIWLVLLTDQMTVIGQPYLWFAGDVDGPALNVGGEEIGIKLAIESKLANHERANALKYTSADQRLLYPDDTAFDHVEELNDIALRIAN